VLRWTDRSHEAQPPAEEAVGLFDLEGTIVSAAKARTVLAAVR
jgi:hypothetical protein